MHLILTIIALIIFMAISPRFFKWLLAIDLLIAIGGYILLRVLALFFGAGRGGRNAGMFQDEATSLAMLMMAAPVIVVIGIIAGGIVIMVRKSG